MNEQKPLCESLPPAELRALYDIRVKEAHHYNTLIWAFPLAYGTLMTAEYRFMEAGSCSLIVAGTFNMTLWYVFSRHLKNKVRIQKVLEFTEAKLAELYGKNFVPDFPKGCSIFRATTVMKWTLAVITLAFLARAVATKPDDETCCQAKSVAKTTNNPTSSSATDTIPTGAGSGQINLESP